MPEHHMEFHRIFRERSFATQYSAAAVEADCLQRILEAAGNAAGFLQQFPIRFLVVQDIATRDVLQRACMQQRERWLQNVVDWMSKVLEESGETQRLNVLRDAPCVICVFGDIEQPAWREVGWAAVERLRLAAYAEGLHAEPVTVESLDFLNPLLDVPQTWTALALLTLGTATTTEQPAVRPPALDHLLLPYEPDVSRLRSWDNPVQLGQLSRHADKPPRSLLTDRQLMFHAMRTATAIHSCRSADEIFACVMQELVHFFRFDRSSVSFLDPRSSTLRLRNIQSFDAPPIGENRPIPLDESNVIGWVVLNACGVLRNEIANEDVFDEQMCSEELRSDMIVPILCDNRVFGTLNCGSRRPYAFHSMDFDVLRELGRVVGEALGRLGAPAGERPSQSATAVPPAPQSSGAG
jgi:hypothetical protein